MYTRKHSIFYFVHFFFVIKRESDPKLTLTFEVISYTLYIAEIHGKSAHFANISGDVGLFFLLFFSLEIWATESSNINRAKANRSSCFCSLFLLLSCVSMFAYVVLLSDNKVSIAFFDKKIFYKSNLQP
jgi:hypothetical protein